MLKCGRLDFKKKKLFVVKEGINAVINSASKEIDTMGMVTRDLSEIYNDSLKSEEKVLHQCLN